MSPAVEIVSLLVVAATVAGLSRRLGASAPLVLVAIGVACSFIGFIPRVDVDPHVILIGLLPPLLYAAAIRTSLIDFRVNRQAILLLSIGLVAFSTIVVGLVGWWLVPGVSLAAGLALAQVGVGLLDVATLAPVCLQLVHVVLADAVWIAMVLTAAAALAVVPETAPAADAEAVATARP